MHLRKIVIFVLSCMMVGIVCAVPKTYTQNGAKNTFAIERSGVPGTSEITDTPQLAFPGVTLDDIHGCQFISELYDGGVDNRMPIHGLFPKKHRVNGHVEKMCLQFGTNEGSWSKFVILILTNGADGVYVQKFGACNKQNMSLRYDFMKMDANGNISFRTDGDKPYWSTTGGGSYKAWGIRIFGIMPSPSEARLAFPGATLKDLKYYDFVLGAHVGGGIDIPNYHEVADCVKSWPSDDDIQKMVIQFCNKNYNDNRVALIELTEQPDGVYAQHKWKRYKGGDEFELDDSGNPINHEAQSGEYGSYTPWGLYAVPKELAFVSSSEPTLLWTKKGGVLTLNDLVGASFSAAMAGSSIYPGGIKTFSNLYVENAVARNPVVGLNTREKVDANGDIIEIVTEFQYNEPVNNSGVRCVVVKFTNGEDGVYGQAMAARNEGASKYGYVFSDDNGNYYGESSSIAAARDGTTFNGECGVFNLQAVAETAKIYRQGPTYTFGVMSRTPDNSTMVPNFETVGFSGMKLEDFKNSTFFSYFGGTAVNTKQYLLGKHPQFYPSEGTASKLGIQFSINDGTHRKINLLELAYNEKGAVTINRVQKLWTTKGDEHGIFFSFDNEGNFKYENMSGENLHNNDYSYALYGLQVFPQFVKTEPILLFKGVSLNDIENAVFSARVGGRSVGALNNRVSGYNKRVIKNGDDVTHILVEFQSATDWIKTIIVEFTNGEDGVYGVAKEARYTNLSNGLGFQFVTEYDGVSEPVYAGNDSDPAVLPNVGAYGVYDVQALVEQDANEWVLDQDRNWSFYTDNEILDDDSATIRIKVTNNDATLTIDEDVNIGRIVFVNETGADVATTTISVASGTNVSVGEIEIGANVNVLMPSSLGSVKLGKGSTISYSGNITVSGSITGNGGVEVLSGRVTFNGANDFTGGLVVKSGAVAVANRAVGDGEATGPFGKIEGRVTIEDGGMVDINGKDGLSYRYTIAGSGVATGGIEEPGPIVNLGSALDIGNRTGNSKANTIGHSLEFALASDITLGMAGGDIGLVSKSQWETAKQQCKLDLGKYSFTKKGSGTFYLWSQKLDVIGSGSIVVEEGAVDIRKGSYEGQSSTVSINKNGTLRLGESLKAKEIVNNGRMEITCYWTGSWPTVSLTGAYSGDGVISVLEDGKFSISNDGLSVCDFVNNGTVSGEGMLTVKGTLTAGNAIPNLTLEDGATIKMPSPSASQSVAGTFNAAGTITVDATAISSEEGKEAESMVVLSAPSIPEDVHWKLKDSVGGRNIRIRRNNDSTDVLLVVDKGLYLFIR